MSAVTTTERSHPILTALLLAVLVAGLNVGLWFLGNIPRGPDDWNGPISGFAFTAYQRYQNPMRGDTSSDPEIASDLRLVHRYSPRIRTYSMLENPQTVRLADKEGLDVMAGANIDTRLENNEREIDALIAQAHRFPKTISRVIVGNEVLYRGDLKPEQMMAYLDRVRAAVHQPVSMAEPFHVWIQNPELADHVDFITVHLFPYWNGIDRKDAVPDSIGTRNADGSNNTDGSFQALQQRFPGKHITIGEIGWPSNGDRHEYAYPTVSNEAIFLRDFFNVAKRKGIDDYYVLEAIDQPWKENLGEGRTGAYWGMFNADRQLKFPFKGPVTEDTSWPWKAFAASVLAFFPMVWFGSRFRRFKLMGRLFFMALLQLACGLIVWSATLPFNFYLSPFDWAMLILLFPAQIAILAILLINGFEFTEVLWRREWIRHAGMLPYDPVEKQPFVSIHLACHNEPPEMVAITLDSLAALNYENFEVLVLDNNTKDPAVWEPVKAYCEKLGPKFRFFHLEPWPGYKAGALN